MGAEAHDAAGSACTVVITGTGGLGYEAALALARLGFAIILAGRNGERGSAATASLAREVSACNASFELLDLASLVSVEAFSKRMLQRGRRWLSSLGLLLAKAVAPAGRSKRQQGPRPRHCDPSALK
jgi:NAD(P)-dependent dehydrogenase (short-subunit alcohol dehydrogenase family)